MSDLIKEYDELSNIIDKEIENNPEGVSEEIIEFINRANKILVEMSDEEVEVIYNRPVHINHKMHIYNLRKEAGKFKIKGKYLNMTKEEWKEYKIKIFHKLLEYENKEQCQGMMSLADSCGNDEEIYPLLEKYLNDPTTSKTRNDIFKFIFLLKDGERFDPKKDKVILNFEYDTSFENFKVLFNKLDSKVEPKIYIKFKNKIKDIYITKYDDYVSIKEDGEDELKYKNIDELYNADDSILLKDNWDKIESIKYENKYDFFKEEEYILLSNIDWGFNVAERKSKFLNWLDSLNLIGKKIVDIKSTGKALYIKDTDPNIEELGNVIITETPIVLILDNNDTIELFHTITAIFYSKNGYNKYTEDVNFKGLFKELINQEIVSYEVVPYDELDQRYYSFVDNKIEAENTIWYLRITMSNGYQLSIHANMFVLMKDNEFTTILQKDRNKYIKI